MDSWNAAKGHHAQVGCACNLSSFAVWSRASSTLRCRVGRVHRNHKGYEEVLVPAVKAGVPGAGEQLERINELDDWAQLAFEGYKCAPATLQSAVKLEYFSLAWQFE